jgi:putative PIN family toxin of toxin-antitoxin system
MRTPRVVLDTNVLLSALRSKRGASFRGLNLVGRAKFEICVSVPLVLEYESAAKRYSRSLGLRHSDIDDILDYLCRVGEHREIFYLWRPFLKNPMDDMVLELAVEGQSDFVVTHNIPDFAGIEEFRIRAITPQALLRKIGEIP